MLEKSDLYVYFASNLSTCSMIVLYVVLITSSLYISVIIIYLVDGLCNCEIISHIELWLQFSKCKSCYKK